MGLEQRQETRPLGAQIFEGVEVGQGGEQAQTNRDRHFPTVAFDRRSLLATLWGPPYT